MLQVRDSGSYVDDVLLMFSIMNYVFQVKGYLKVGCIKILIEVKH